MRLQDNEYDIVDEAINDGGVGIFIEKAALEKWRDRYLRLMKKRQGDTIRCRRLYGQVSILDDMLRLFVK